MSINFHLHHTNEWILLEDAYYSPLFNMSNLMKTLPWSIDFKKISKISKFNRHFLPHDKLLFELILNKETESLNVHHEVVLYNVHLLVGYSGKFITTLTYN